MPHVTALYRYPVKGFTPEHCDSIELTADGRVAGDRVLGFRFGDSRLADDAWGPKTGFVVLMNTPGLARIRLRYHDAVHRISMRLDDEPLIDAGLDPEGRARLANVVTKYVLGLDESPIVGHPERAPLRLIGDGATPRFHDRGPGYVTLHSRESLAALAASLSDDDLDERRFRSNVAIEGVEDWQELSWSGRVSVGDVQLRVEKVVTRCLAPEANPRTGLRDAPILTTLTGPLGQDVPTFGIALSLVGPSGTIRVGDPVNVR